VLATTRAIEKDHSEEGGPTFSGKIADLERHKLVLIQELCQSERRLEQAEKETARLKGNLLTLEEQDIQKTGLINQYRKVTVQSLEDTNRAFEMFRLARLTSKPDRGQSNVIGDGYNSSEGDEECMSLE
jgi:hypothetical protein